MDKKTRTALEKSIQHWTELAEASEGDLAKLNVTGSACALCHKFAQELRCSGCPVAERTGKPNCEDSPWEAAYLWKGRDFAKWQIAAKRELKFLVSLREEED